MISITARTPVRAMLLEKAPFNQSKLGIRHYCSKKNNLLTIAIYKCIITPFKALTVVTHSETEAMWLKY